MKLLLVVLVSLLALKCFCDSSSATISKSIEINEKNWEELLSSGEWMVEFFAPWCPACNRFQSTWDEFALKQEQLNIRVGSADVNANPVLSGLFSVTSLPTIYHIKDGQYRIYHGPRDLLQLVDYIRNNEWKKTEPSSAWLAPNSVLIKALSILFKMTIYFKDVYTKLTDTYGYPVWAVLTLFVIVTIILGLLLGIFFIILIDCLCPPKRPTSDELKEMPGDDVLEEKEGEEKEGESSKSKSDKSGDNKDLKNRKKAKKDQ